MHDQLHHAISGLTAELAAGREQRKHEFEWLKSHAGLATKQDLIEQVNKIMSAISDFAAKQKVHNDAIDAAITGLTNDVSNLNEKITELQNTAGQITPEDQALLDDIDTRSSAIADKLAALDALTPPKPPVA